jgi:RNA polymerase sigma factor (sigma-70 family)
LERVDLDEATLVSVQRPKEVIALDDALTALAALDARQAQVVEMRYFVGLSAEETAEVLGVSATTVNREWRAAKLWLYRELKVEDGSE